MLTLTGTIFAQSGDKEFKPLGKSTVLANISSCFKIKYDRYSTSFFVFALSCEIYSPTFISNKESHALSCRF
jgi:hypothetical protein